MVSRTNPQSTPESHRKAPANPGSRRKAFAWNPSTDTYCAAAGVLAFWGCYYLGSRPGTTWALIVGVILVGTILPAWVVFRLLGQGWDQLGITRHRLIVSLAVAAVLGAGSFMGLRNAAQQAHADLVPHLIANIAVFWEPFLVFGFFFLRWEKAFGYIAAPILTALGFALQHVGAVPLPIAASFGAFALVFGIVFALTRNLFILWPLFYGVASGIGTLQSGLAFGWSEAWFGIGLFVAQVAILGAAWWLWRRRSAQHAGA